MKIVSTSDLVPEMTIKCIRPAPDHTSENSAILNVLNAKAVKATAGRGLLSSSFEPVVNGDWKKGQGLTDPTREFLRDLSAGTPDIMKWNNVPQVPENFRSNPLRNSPYKIQPVHGSKKQGILAGPWSGKKKNVREISERLFHRNPHIFRAAEYCPEGMRGMLSTHNL
jgi:hypothetical protein